MISQKINEYLEFTSSLYGEKRKVLHLIYDFRFWVGLALYLSSTKSHLPKFLKWILIVLLRFFSGIETTTRCEIINIPYLPHPRNIVNGARFIGKNVVIYHNVTIGAKRIDIHFTDRPAVLSNCVLATGSVIVGSGALNEKTVVKANSLMIL